MASTTNLSPNLAITLCYAPIIGGLVSLVLFLVEKDARVRWHALQSLLLTLVLLALTFIPFLGILVGLAGFVLSLVLTVKAYQGAPVRLPVLADWADKVVKKV